jgi:hypothetical protein
MRPSVRHSCKQGIQYSGKLIATANDGYQIEIETHERPSVALAMLSHRQSTVPPINKGMSLGHVLPYLTIHLGIEHRDDGHHGTPALLSTFALQHAGHTPPFSDTSRFISPLRA